MYNAFCLNHAHLNWKCMFEVEFLFMNTGVLIVWMVLALIRQ